MKIKQGSCTCFLALFAVCICCTPEKDEPAGDVPVASFSASPTIITVGEGVQFTDQSSNSPTSWNWDFGDGSSHSTNKNPTHIYNNDGTYSVSLTVSNSFGSDTEEEQDYITVNPAGNPPAANFTTSRTNITAGQFVQFSDLSSNAPTSWSWTFGDGGTSIAQNPSHTYSTAGVYTVTLTAGNSAGSDEEMKGSYIVVNAGVGGSVTDGRDGRRYNWIEIGGQVWLAENMNLGNSLNVTQEQTNNSVFEKYCYDNNEASCNVYGGLYQWQEAMQYSASDNGNPGHVQGVCPAGWHIPTNNEWKQLEMYLGMNEWDADDETWRYNDVGGKLKESNYEHWAFPNAGATNVTGFTALPGGKRGWDPMEFSLITTETYIWAATEKTGELAFLRHLVTHEPGIGFESYFKTNGFSVRCIKN